jgi:hypothetical protein
VRDDRGVGAAREDQLRVHEPGAGLTLLAPDIVEAILDGQQADGLRLEDLLVGFPLDWKRQRFEVD